MHCPQKLSYIIREGDNLYQLARYYQTTVPSIISHNPSIDPYNLQIGSQIIICPGEKFVMQLNNPYPPACPNPSTQISLMNNMKLAWLQHIYWTRLLLISIIERLKDQDDVTNRLLQNPYDIANIFSNYYSSDVTNIITQLLTEHLQIGAALITALRDGKTAAADNLNQQWYINADKMADAFSSINPYYNHEEIKKMLYAHLQLTTQEVSARLAKNYPTEIKAFNKVEQQAISMADYFSSGIMRQFPQKFK